MATREEILMSMNVLELSRATDMAKKAEQRISKAFNTVREKCELHSKTEPIGFEGVIFVQCNHMKHPHAHSIYPACTPNECALIMGEA